jgi:hypothetical protein
MEYVRAISRRFGTCGSIVKARDSKGTFVLINAIDVD